MYSVNVTLVDGTSKYNGFVKVAINGVPSGSICDSNHDWTLREGDVVCRTLGFGYALNVSVVKSNLEPRVNNVRCDGNEVSLSQCTRGGPCLQRAELAPTVNCSGPLGTCQGEKTGVWVETPIKLSQDLHSGFISL